MYSHQSSFAPIFWQFKSYIWSLVLNILNEKEKSSTQNLSRIWFQMCDERDVNVFDVFPKIIKVCFLSDRLYWEYNDIGSLNFNILKVSMRQWYEYRLWIVSRRFLLNRGLVCSLTKTSFLTNGLKNGLTLAAVLNLSRYFVCKWMIDY